MSLPSGINHYHPIGEVIQKTYSKFPNLVKSADAARSCPLLSGFANVLINSLPFGLIWLTAGVNTLAAGLAAFSMMLFYCLRENYLRNRLLSEMARKLKEQGNA